MNQGSGTERLRPITVRFTQDVYDAIADMSYENCISQAELVRMAVAGNLSRYLGDIRIIDKQQGAEIKEQVTAIFDAVSRVENELHRIGVNFNQAVRLKSIERKYGTTFNADRDEEERAVRGESVNLSKAELDAIISRYEQATRQVGDSLCRILT